jgi:hypothetical protein
VVAAFFLKEDNSRDGNINPSSLEFANSLSTKNKSSSNGRSVEISLGTLGRGTVGTKPDLSYDIVDVTGDSFGMQKKQSLP